MESEATDQPGLSAADQHGLYHLSTIDESREKTYLDV
jgi:hypothetical protein